MTVVKQAAKSDIADERLELWHFEPDTMAFDLWGVTMDAWQKKTARAFPYENNISMQACKGPGKSAVLGMLGVNFMLTRPDAKCIACSISADNLADGLWTEFAKWINRSDLTKKLLKWTKTRITHIYNPQEWYISARTWPKQADATQQADALQGLHGEYTLVLMDETGGMPEAIMTTVEATQAVGIENKIIQAGNPSHLAGPLYNASTRDRHRWYVVEITGDPEDPNRSPRIDIGWAQNMIDTYGRDSAWVMINVLGKFPPSSLNQLLGPDEIRAAVNRHLEPHQYIHSQKRIGCDVARYGADDTIAVRRQGLRADWPMETITNPDTQNIGGTVLNMKREFGCELEFIDGTGGFGSGVVDVLRSAGGNPIEVHFSSSAIDSQAYFNRRTEMWYEMAQWIKRGGSIPNDPKLHRELAAPLYDFDNRGRFKLESKEEMKKRLGFSPDRADALALTFALPDVTLGVSQSGLILGRGRGNQDGVDLRRAPSEFERVMGAGGGGGGRRDWDPLDTDRW